MMDWLLNLWKYGYRQDPIAKSAIIYGGGYYECDGEIASHLEAIYTR
jgi:hypothetical protein